MGIKKEKAGSGPAFRYASAMLIDDSEIDNFINQKILESNYFAQKVYVNTGGISALEFIKNLTVNEHLTEQMMPDVIFVDLNMPLMDGFQFINQFLKLPESIIRKSKLIILTSSFNPEDREKAHILFKDIVFLNKPLTDHGLASII